MKFATVWKTKLEDLPPFLKSTCIDYKKYKKLTKIQHGHAPEFFHNLLNADIKLVDNVFKALKRGSCAAVKTDTKTLLEYAILNSRCLYKSCKRIDKRLGISDFKSWYSFLLTQKEHKFLSRQTQAWLRLKTANQQHTEECPVCLEQVDDMLVLQCGHILCVECTLNMLGVAQSKGTLHNRIAFGNYNLQPKCPVCRDAHAFVKYKEYTSNKQL